MLEDFINFGKNSYDLNSMFMFQFNFDILKQIITELSHTQRRNTDNFSSINDIIKEKELIIENQQQEMFRMNNAFKIRIENVENIILKSEMVSEEDKNKLVGEKQKLLEQEKQLNEELSKKREEMENKRKEREAEREAQRLEEEQKERERQERNKLRADLDNQDAKERERIKNLRKRKLDDEMSDTKSIKSHIKDGTIVLNNDNDVDPEKNKTKSKFINTPKKTLTTNVDDDATRKKNRFKEGDGDEEESSKMKVEKKLESPKRFQKNLHQEKEYNVTFETDESLEGLARRVKKLEGITKDLILVKLDMEEVKGAIQEHDHDILELRQQMKEIKGFNEKVREKVFDFDIDDPEGFGGNNLDEFNPDGDHGDYSGRGHSGLDSNEKQGLKNIKDELKKFRLEIGHIKNEQTKNSGFFNDKIDTIMINLDNIKKKLNIASEEEVNIFDTKIEDLRKFVLQKMGEYDQLGEDEGLEDINDVDEKEPGEDKDENLDTVDGETGKRISKLDANANNSDLGKRTVILEKQFKVIKTQVADLIKLKATNDSLNQVKVDVKNTETVINVIKDQILNMMEDVKILEDFTRMKKKVDMLTVAFEKLDNLPQFDNSKKGSDIDPTKFVEITVFQEFSKNFQKESENLMWRMDELNRLNEEVLGSLKSKVSEKEMKVFEDHVIEKIDDLKIAYSKKFADKNDTLKHFRFLDVQLRNILEGNVKKGDKGDNWLLAKKPLGGHMCASCETYIGDLSENNQHMPYKYPVGEQPVKSYRMGNGYSKILQMVNFENNNLDNNGVDQANVVLPPLTIKRDIQNLSADQINTEENIDESRPIYNDSFKPKIVKMYKKVKKDPKFEEVPKDSRIKEV